MEKTIFEISKMDCPSEENLIRMKLDEISNIAHLEFNIAKRELTIFHTGNLEEIEESIIELKLGGKKIASEQTDQTSFQEQKSTKITLDSSLDQLPVFHYRNDNRSYLKINGTHCR